MKSKKVNKKNKKSLGVVDFINEYILTYLSMYTEYHIFQDHSRMEVRIKYSFISLFFKIKLNNV